MVENAHTAGALSGLADPLRSLGKRLADWFAPASEASVNTDCYEIVVEVPGVSVEAIDVSVHDGSLVIHGEKRFEHQESGKTYFFSERQYGAFQRTFRLPPDADSQRVVATCKDGVLTVKIAKRDPHSDGRKKIEVRQA